MEMATLEVRAAYDDSLLETLPLMSEGEALQALARAHDKFQDRDAWLEPYERIEILERLATLVEERKDALALQAAREGGKPLVDSRVELARGIDGIRVAISALRGLGGKEIPMRITPSSAGRSAFTYREPRGVVLAISAFNHPFNLIVHQVVTAVAAGCPVLVKPARATPLSCQAVVTMLLEAGLPEDWCQMVLTDNTVTGRLVEDRRVAFLTFIGSDRVGWSLRARLAPGAHCALEHGGVAPVVVEPSADLADAIPLLVKGGFYHAGQVCVSVQRIFVHDSVLEEFVRDFAAAASRLRVGDPASAETDVGPLIARQEVDRVDEWVKEAAAGGGQIVVGGERVGASCYAPTVVLNPPDDARLSLKEVFGPVVAIYGYSELDDAIARANAADSFFQASIFTGELETALDVSRRLHGMAVMVNDHTAFRVDWMPFGGHGNSGLGSGGIGYSIEDMTLERMVVFRRLPKKAPRG